MELYEAIFLRRTIRDFSDKEIETDIIKKILNAGLQAPTNNHMKEWEFIVLKDKMERLSVLDKISKNTTKKDAVNIIDHWGLIDDEQRGMYIDGIPKQYQMLLSAGCLIVPFFRTYEPLLTPTSLSSLNGFASIWCCIENILVAAAAEGIFGVTRIPFADEINHVKSILKVPENYDFPCYIALGYPSNESRVFSPKATIEEKIHFNQW